MSALDVFIERKLSQILDVGPTFDVEKQNGYSLYFSGFCNFSFLPAPYW